MLFSRDKDSKSPKKRSTLGTLFNPDIGGSIRPLGESITMFVRLIALIFAANRLFPRNHPALLGNPEARLTMGEIITTAWRSLTFTREGLPQILLFFAVVGCLVFSALFVITFALSLFVGHAHAAGAGGPATGMFDTPDTTKDLAHNWLGYLFKGETMQNLYTQTGFQVPQAQNVQTAMKTALAFYSGAILVFAGFILLYHLIVMIAETAHTGKVMGNANQIWAPIRLVFAIGLLVPVGSAGLNTGQYIMVQMADWGSGLATNVWKRFLSSIADINTNFVPPPTPQVTETVRNITLTLACQRAYNYYVDDLKQGLSPNPTFWSQFYVNNYGSGTSYVYGNKRAGEQDICGGWNFNDLLTNSTFPQVGVKATNYDQKQKELLKELYQANIDAVNNAVPKITALAEKIDLWISTSPAAINNTDGAKPPNTELRKIVSEYHKDVQDSLSTLFSNPTDDQIKNLSEKWSDYGWVTAGAWFNTIARTQAHVINASRDSLPKTFPPSLSLTNSGPLDDYETRAAQALTDFTAWLDAGYDHDPAAFSSGAIYNEKQSMGHDARAGLPAPEKNRTWFLLDTVMWIISGAAQDVGLIDANSNFILASGQTANPLAELAALGQKSIITAFNSVENAMMLVAGSILLQKGSTALVSFLGGKIPLVGNKIADIINGGLDVLGGITQTMAQMNLVISLVFGGILFAVGITLAFALPMLPFIVFFFNVITWVVSVFEAVVSMPLFALAHLTTKGEGLPGDMAKTGYFFIFSIFLRPTLMIFGLVAALLIFFVAVAFLNMTFGVAALGSGNFGATGGLYVLSSIVFFIIYTTLVYIAANTAFKTVNFFPEHAMSWMGQRGVSTEKMGNKQLMDSATKAIAAYGFKETMQSISQIPEKVAQVGKKDKTVELLKSIDSKI